MSYYRWEGNCVYIRVFFLYTTVPFCIHIYTHIHIIRTRPLQVPSMCTRYYNGWSFGRVPELFQSPTAHGRVFTILPRINLFRELPFFSFSKNLPIYILYVIYVLTFSSFIVTSYTYLKNVAVQMKENPNEKWIILPEKKNVILRYSCIFNLSIKVSWYPIKTLTYL